MLLNTPQITRHPTTEGPLPRSVTGATVEECRLTEVTDFDFHFEF